MPAFLEATLHDDTAYLPLFRDPRAGADWLPDGIVYLAQFEDSTFQAVADFEEDLDVTTASLEGAVIETDGLTVWREEALRFRDDLTQGTNGVVIGSDGEEQGSYSIRFGERRPTLDASASLTFFLSSSIEKVGEKLGEKAGENAGEDEETVLGLILELEDASGTTQAVAVSDIAPMTPPLKVQFLKLELLNRKRFPKNWEPTFQSYEIPLARFEKLDVGQLAVIRFRTEGSGVVILDDIGFRRSH